MPGPPPTAYLEGGPCAGTTRKLTGAELRSGTLTCKGATYNHTNDLHGSDVVFKLAAPTQTGSGGTASSLPHGHSGFNAFEKELAHGLPTKLRRARAVRLHTLRKLGAPRNLGG